MNTEDEPHAADRRDASDLEERLLDEAIEQLRREYPPPPSRMPSPEDLAALQQMLASHNRVVATLTAWREQRRAEKGPPGLQGAI